jgi:hypothetical protein
MFEKFKRYPVFTKVLIITCAVVLLATVGCVIAVVATGGF